MQLKFMQMAKNLKLMAALFLALFSIPSLAGAADTFSWSIGLDAASVDYDIDKARDALHRARELGMKAVRTNFDWNRFEPLPGSWDPYYQRFFDEYLNEAKAQGLEVIAVLHRPPVWAMETYLRGEVESFFRSFERYTRKVASLYGDRLTYYQYWDEPNNDVIDPIKREDDWLLLLHGDRGVRTGDHNGHRGMVNLATDFYNGRYWVADLTHAFKRLNLIEPQHTVRIIGLNLYPETWSAGGNQAWKALRDLKSLLEDPRHPCYGYEGAIAETGYSTYAPLNWSPVQQKREQEQEAWYRKAIKELRNGLVFSGSSTAARSATARTARFLFVNFHELSDSKIASPFEPDAYFGLYTSEMRSKPAAESVRRLLNPPPSDGVADIR